VIPKIGGTVQVLLGKHRGEFAKVINILKDDFLLELELDSGKRVLEEYEHASKVM
jgi:hypothetical protein